MYFSSWEFSVCVFAPDTLCRKGLKNSMKIASYLFNSFFLARRGEAKLHCSSCSFVSNFLKVQYLFTKILKLLILDTYQIIKILHCFYYLMKISWNIYWMTYWKFSTITLSVQNLSWTYNIAQKFIFTSIALKLQLFYNLKLITSPPHTHTLWFSPTAMLLFRLLLYMSLSVPNKNLHV